MTAETVTITEVLSEYTLDASVNDPGQPNRWAYVIYLGGTINDQNVVFNITVAGNPWPLQLGEKYVLKLTPVPGETGGIVCTSFDEFTGGNPDGQAGITTEYTYKLAYEASQDPSPLFDGFVLTPAAPLPLVVGQVYTCEFQLASAAAPGQA
jgi:hypothetical protein